MSSDRLFFSGFILGLILTGLTMGYAWKSRVQSGNGFSIGGEFFYCTRFDPK